MPLVISSFGGGDTHTHKYTCIQTFADKAILRNQLHAGQRGPAAGFKKAELRLSYRVTEWKNSFMNYRICGNFCGNKISCY